jgi:hypothetical protein
MVYRVEGILDIEVQDNGYAVLSPLLFSKDTVYFSQLAFSASMPAEAFLRVIHEPIIFHVVVKPLVNNGEEERVLGTDAADWSKIRHKQGQ